MPATFLIGHWKKELQVFHKNLLLLKKSAEKEAIHDLRVSIKKLRSYSKVYFALKDSDAKNLFAETSMLFATLGRQRNIEIGIELLEPFNKQVQDSGLKKYFHFLLDETRQRSQYAIENYSTENLRLLTLEIEKDLSEKNDEEVKTIMVELIGSWIDDVRSQLAHLKKRYHLVRKKLKDIFYWYQILQDEKLFSNEAIKKLKSVLDDLGEAQDHELFLVHLKSYRNTIPQKGGEEFILMKKIEKTVKEKKAGLLEKVSQKLADLVDKNKKSDPF